MALRERGFVPEDPCTEQWRDLGWRVGKGEWGAGLGWAGAGEGNLGLRRSSTSEISMSETSGGSRAGQRLSHTRTAWSKVRECVLHVGWRLIAAAESVGLTTEVVTTRGSGYSSDWIGNRGVQLCRLKGRVSRVWVGSRYGLRAGWVRESEEL